MKMTMVVIVVLGLMAALAAAVLVQVITMPARPAAVVPAASAEVEVIVAARDLPAMKVVGQDAVIVKKVPKSTLPARALTNPIQVVGKVLIVPVVEGEAFTDKNFTPDGSGVNLAAALPAGKRAMSVTLNDSTGMVGLLYPGSVVDVMVSVQAKQGQGEGETITRTLLQGVQVLAIGQESVASERIATNKSPGVTGPKGDQRMVTLMVDQSQAQALQLATQRGQLSLSMRNPLDQDPVQTRATRLVDLAGNQAERPAMGSLAASIVQGATASMQAALARQASAPKPEPPKADPPKPAPVWKTEIYRGEKTEVRTFPMPEPKVAGEVELEK